MVKRVVILLALMCMPLAMADNIQINFIKNGSSGYESGYRNYVYRNNPPRQTLVTNGRYVMGTSTVRYVHSPSKLKGAKQAARIDYYNSMYY